MDAIEVNRAELAWALRAVLPHVGPHYPMDTVGMDGTYLWATDRYTLGMATVAARLPSCLLPADEAKDLERSVRVSRKADEEDSVWLVHDGYGLHVQVGDGPGEVYDLSEWGIPYSFVHEHIESLSVREPEYQGLIVQPKLLSRFTKAAKHDSDRLVLDGYGVDSEHGTILVRVGDSFVGAIGGLTYHGGPVGAAA